MEPTEDMSVTLSEKDRQQLDGECGEAAQMAMRILVRMADVVGADEMMDISQAHIDGCGLLSEAGLEFAESLASKGGKVTVPTTLNMGPLDVQNWERFGVDKAFASKGLRQGKAYMDMGCIPTWSCAPYQSYLAPRFGQQIAWGESNAVAYANSVLGARTNRYGDYIDICAAITGRVPRYGLHIKENRRGQILLRLKDIEPAAMRDNTFYVVLGHLLGSIAEDKIPVIEGIDAEPSSDDFKALCAAAASSGQVAMFHIIGITPEADTAEIAFWGREPERVIEIGPADMLKAESDLSTADERDKLDMVVLGCPHFSFDEFRELAELLRAEMDAGRGLHPDVRFIVISCQTSYSLAQRGDFLDVLSEFGVEITLDTCIFHTPMVSADTKVIITNSGKCAYYAPGELGVEIAFAGMAECVKSAVEGCVCRKESLWKES